MVCNIATKVLCFFQRQLWQLSVLVVWSFLTPPSNSQFCCVELFLSLQLQKSDAYWFDLCLSSDIRLFYEVLMVSNVVLVSFFFSFSALKVLQILERSSDVFLFIVAPSKFT